MATVRFGLREWDGEREVCAYFDGEEKQLNTTLDYSPKWTFLEGLREYEQNRTDQERRGFETKLVFDAASNTIRFWTSSIIQPKAILYGFSDKRGDDSVRGQFGDGLKRGTVAFLRDGVSVVWIIGDRGTTQVIQLSPEQFPEAKDFLGFAFLMDETERILPERPGKLYVNGIFVKDVDSKYGFNLRLSKDSMNAERDLVDESTLYSEIGSLLATSKDETVIRAFLKQEDKALGKADLYNYFFRLDGMDRWTEVFLKTFGKNAALWTSGNMAAQAEYEDAKIIRLPDQHTRVLQNFLPTDKKYLCDHSKNNYVKVPRCRLSKDQALTLRKIQRLTDKAYPDANIKIIPVESPEPWTALAINSLKDMAIKIECLNDEEAAVGALIHELGHIVYKTNDNTTDQEIAKERVSKRLVVCLLRNRR